MDLFSYTTDADIAKEKTRARLLRRTGWWKRKIAAGRCHYCGRKVAPAKLTMDHVVPLARGGKSVKNNLVAACKECNNRKKDSLVFEWDEYVEKS
jgi:5-methylcytosine-specific restriction endonuclease McrA